MKVTPEEAEEAKARDKAQDTEFWAEVKRREPPKGELGTPIHYKSDKLIGHRRPSDGKAEFFHPEFAEQFNGALAPYAAPEPKAKPKPKAEAKPKAPKKQPADVQHRVDLQPLPEGVDAGQTLPDDLKEIPLTLRGNNPVAFANDIDQALYGFKFGPHEQRADFKEWLEHIGFPVTPVTAGRLSIANAQLAGGVKRTGYKGTVSVNPIYDAPATKPAKQKETARDAPRAEGARVPAVEAPRGVQEDAQDASD